MSRADPLIPGFTLDDIKTLGARIRVSRGGAGPPLLLLHGHPQNHVTWCKAAPRFAESYSIVAPDLRGYGDSGKLPGGAGHVNYSKRAMAQHMIEVMRRLGLRRFVVVGHDRGGRVAHRCGPGKALSAPCTTCSKLGVIRRTTCAATRSDCGHRLQEERPDEFFRAVSDFLADNAAS